MEHATLTPSTGDLKQYMLPEIFLKAVLHQFSGILDIQNNSHTKLIYFKNGNVVFVESNDREETFGHHLMRKKFIDPQSLNEALQELGNEEDLRLGEVLIKKGLIDPNSLMEQLNLHQEEKLFDVFAIKEGTFRFIADQEWPKYVSTFPFRTLNVFFTSIERNITQDEIRDYAMILSHAHVQIKHQPSRDLPLPPFASRLLNSLNRTLVSVEQLSQKMSVSVEKIITFLFIFKIAGWIEIQTVDTKAEAESGGTVSENANSEKPSNEEMVEKREVNPIEIQRLEIDYKTLVGMNFYQIFNIPLEYTTQQLQVKFFQVVAELKKYDDFPKGKEMIVWVKTAYDVLKDPKLRSMYDRRFAFRKKSASVEAAEKIFYRGVRLLEKNDLEAALSIFEEISKEQDSTYRAYQAWTLLRQNPQANIANVLELIEKAFAIYPADPFAHYIAGQIQAHRKNYKKAQEHFRSAIQVYPGYTDAMVALDGIQNEVTKEKVVAKKAADEKAKNTKPGFFDMSVGGFKIGGKE
jgi:tetratricopeptide (TPR) repeat protein